MLATGLFIPSATPAAVPPSLVNYQGVLRSSTGSPLNGTYDMIFRFVDAPAGGTLLLTDLHTGPNGVIVDRGLFTAVLGGGTISPGTQPSLTDVLSNFGSVYVEVQVGAETLSPRVRLLPAAFAVNAGRLGGSPPETFLDVTAASQTKSGALTSNTGLTANAPGAGDAVAGTSALGTGVRGTSNAASGTQYGVYGKSASTTGSGVAGEATATTGSAWGVYGKSASTSGIGVIGSALATSGSTEGVRGQSTSATGRGVVGGAFSTTGDARGVYGESQSADGTGVYGRATAVSGGTTGVGGDCFSPLGTGVAGVANANNGDAWGVYGATLSPTGFGVVADGDSATIGDLFVTGAKNFIVEHPLRPDRTIQYACLEGGEVGVYQRGVGRLTNGEAVIDLPDDFPLVAAGHLTVQVTPLEECGGLFVPQDKLTTREFTVRELGRGRSDASFAWSIMAERAGFENTEVVRPVSLATKILLSPRFNPLQKAALRKAMARIGGEERLEEASRAGLFELVHQGSFEAICRVLGGCAPPVFEPALQSHEAAGVPPAAEVVESARP